MKTKAAVSKKKYLKYLKIPEWSETQSNVKLDGFRSRLQASCVSSHTEEF